MCVQGADVWRSFSACFYPCLLQSAQALGSYMKGPRDIQIYWSTAQCSMLKEDIVWIDWYDQHYYNALTLCFCLFPLLVCACANYLKAILRVARAMFEGDYSMTQLWKSICIFAMSVWSSVTLVDSIARLLIMTQSFVHCFILFLCWTKCHKNWYISAINSKFSVGH